MGKSNNIRSLKQQEIESEIKDNISRHNPRRRLRKIFEIMVIEIFLISVILFLLFKDSVYLILAFEDLIGGIIYIIQKYILKDIFHV